MKRYIDPGDISPIYRSGGIQERGILEDGFPVRVIGARFLSNRSLRPISQRVRGNVPPFSSYSAISEGFKPIR